MRGLRRTTRRSESKRYNTGHPLDGPRQNGGYVFGADDGSAMFEAFCRAFFIFYCRLTVAADGINFPASPFIICSNHTSHVDSAVLMTASGLPFSAFALLGASDYFFDSWRRKFLVSRFMNVIPIERRAQPKSLQRCLAMCADFLQHGNLILYPEGTRSPDGEIQSFKKGADVCRRPWSAGRACADRGRSSHSAQGRVHAEAGASPCASESLLCSNRILLIFGAGAGRRTAVELIEQRIRGMKPADYRRSRYKPCRDARGRSPDRRARAQ